MEWWRDGLQALPPQLVKGVEKPVEISALAN